MSKNVKTIKALRENFLKRHQLDLDFFTVPTIQQSSFADDAIFYPPTHTRSTSNCQLINKSIKKGSSLSTPAHHRHTASDHPLNIKINCQKSSLESTRKVMDKTPIFSRGQKIKNKTYSARPVSVNIRSQATLPKYAVFLMKPCTVQTIKISSRPQSALVTSRKRLSVNQQSKRDKSQSKKKSRREQVLLPWQTDINDYFQSA